MLVKLTWAALAASFQLSQAGCPPPLGPRDPVQKYRGTAGTPCAGTLAGYLKGAPKAPPRGALRTTVPPIPPPPGVNAAGAGRIVHKPRCCGNPPDDEFPARADDGAAHRRRAPAAKSPPAAAVEIEVLTVDVPLAAAVRADNATLARGLAGLLGLPAARVEVLPESYPLQPRKEVPCSPSPSPAPAPGSAPAPALLLAPPPSPTAFQAWAPSPFPIAPSPFPVAPSPSPVPQAELPKRVQMLSTDPCLVILLRASPKFYIREIAHFLGVPTQALVLDPPLAEGDPPTTSPAPLLLQRAAHACALPRQPLLGGEPLSLAPRRPAGSRPRGLLLAAGAGAARGGAASGAGAGAGAGGRQLPPPPLGLDPSAPLPPLLPILEQPSPAPGPAPAQGPSPAPGPSPGPSPAPEAVVNRPWIAWWSVGILGPEADIKADQLRTAVNTPHGPFTRLLPYTLARVPGLRHPLFPTPPLREAVLPPPRQTALHVGPLVAGDLPEHLTKEAAGVQARADAEISRARAVRMAIESEERKVGAALAGMAHIMAG